MKILTLNVACLPYSLVSNVEERISAICDQILKDNIDIICFQELFDANTQEIVMNKFINTHQYIILDQKDISNCCSCLIYNSGLAIISRYRIISQQFVPFEQIDGLDSFAWKGILGVSFQIAQGKTINIFNLHLMSNAQLWGSRDESNVRIAEINEILDFLRYELIASNQALIVGDFNIKDISAEYQNLMKNFIDMWEYRKNINDPGYTWNPIRNKNMNTGKSPTKFDYILQPNWTTQIEVMNAELFIPGKEPNECLSDHFGITLEIIVDSLLPDNKIKKYEKNINICKRLF